MVFKFKVCLDKEKNKFQDFHWFYENSTEKNERVIGGFWKKF
jgi:hypothetical protein